MKNDKSKRGLRESISQLEEAIVRDYENDRVIDRLEPYMQPDRLVIEGLIGKLFRIVFPGYYSDYKYRVYDLRSSIPNLIEDVARGLSEQIAIALRSGGGLAADCFSRAEELTSEFLSRIPAIRELISTDLAAAFDGDPAAASLEEIIISYPGLAAVTVNRLAHALYELSVPLIPRIMTEYAHSRFGIDIHPGASIGRYFFIDHGTGIVIGETAVIGDNVKIYQSVTLGALSTRGGQRLRGKKRHPTIEDNVTIYAGASILGGETVIGRGSIIGSNAFITGSIEPGTRVSVSNRELKLRSGKPESADAPIEQGGAPVWFYVI
jgi:serine O-acetyltransferase